MPDIFSITEINAHLRQLIEADAALGDVWVQGEVSNLRKASSGHWYFTLKDDRAQLRCVMWRSNASRQFVVPKDGDNIQVHGYVSLYDQRGDVQFYADFIRAAGVGDLYAQFEQLKAKLDAKGLFDAVHKKALPPFPLRLGVVTSPQAAALQDVLNVLARRFPLADVLLAPTLVQGANAPQQIAAAIAQLDTEHLVDVILLVRGGGSIEDLWAFNDEQVARAVFSAATPVVTGIGHETDFTIADFVADHRAPTPSAAAEVATPNLADVQGAVRAKHERLSFAMRAQVHALRDDVSAAAQQLDYRSPAAAVRNYRQRVDELHTRLLGAQGRELSLLRERLTSKVSALHAASPQAILARGYAIVARSDDGAVVRRPEDAPPGTPLHIRLAEGDLNGRAEE